MNSSYFQNCHGLCWRGGVGGERGGGEQLEQGERDRLTRTAAGKFANINGGGGNPLVGFLINQFKVQFHFDSRLVGAPSWFHPTFFTSLLILALFYIICLLKLQASLIYKLSQTGRARAGNGYPWFASPKLTT